VLGDAARAAAADGRPVTEADITAAAGRAALTLPEPVLASMRELLADPPAVLRRRMVTGGWADLPRLLTAAREELDAHRRTAQEARAALVDAEADLFATARSRLSG
jgi:hypothetical protein